MAGTEGRRSGRETGSGLQAAPGQQGPLGHNCWKQNGGERDEAGTC